LSSLSVTHQDIDNIPAGYIFGLRYFNTITASLKAQQRHLDSLLIDKSQITMLFVNILIGCLK